MTEKKQEIFDSRETLSRKKTIADRRKASDRKRTKKTTAS